MIPEPCYFRSTELPGIAVTFKLAELRAGVASRMIKRLTPGLSESCGALAFETSTTDISGTTVEPGAYTSTRSDFPPCSSKTPVGTKVILALVSHWKATLASLAEVVHSSWIAIERSGCNCTVRVTLATWD